MPLVEDESITFFYYINQGTFLPPLAELDANNHFLHSALSYLFTSIFGKSLLAARLTALLSFPLFVIGCLHLASLMKNLVVRYAFVVSSVSCLSLVEFFALSRGYALSFSLLAWSIYFLIQAMDQQKQSLFYWSGICVVLGIYANLSLLNVGLLILLFSLFFSFQYSRLKSGIFLLVSIGALYPGVRHLLTLKEANLLYFGEGGNMYRSTFISLAQSYSDAHIDLAIYLLMGALSFLLILFATQLKELTKKPFQWNSFQVTFLLLFGLIGMRLIQFYVLGVKFPVFRGALHFLLLFHMVLFFGFNQIKNKIFPAIASVLFAVFVLFDTYSTANLDYAREWRLNHFPRSFFSTVLEKQKVSKHILLTSGSGHYRMVWNFYNLQNDFSLNPLYSDDQPNYNCHYIIGNEELVDTINHPFSTIQKSAYSDLRLFERQENIAYALLSKEEHTSIQTDKDFIILHEDSTILKQESHLKIKWKAVLKSKEKEHLLHFVINVENDKKDRLYYRLISFNRDHLSLNEELQTIEIEVPTNQLQAEKIKYTVYLWNPNFVPVYLETSAVWAYEKQR